jgi:2-keto-3-deoxy-L-rhamnonate aldolase RhmA
VAGIDALLVGPYDLSGTLGVPGEIRHPSVAKALARVREAAKAKGMPLGIFSPTAEIARANIASGISLVALGTDGFFCRQVFEHALRDVQRGEAPLVYSCQESAGVG